MATTEGRRLAGVAAAPGVARGAWVHVRRRELPVGGRVTPDAVEAEEARLRAASNQAADDLMALSERVGAAGHDDEAAIFMAHAAMAGTRRSSTPPRRGSATSSRTAWPRSWPPAPRWPRCSPPWTTRSCPRVPPT